MSFLSEDKVLEVVQFGQISILAKDMVSPETTATEAFDKASWTLAYLWIVMFLIMTAAAWAVYVGDWSSSSAQEIILDRVVSYALPTICQQSASLCRPALVTD